MRCLGAEHWAAEVPGLWAGGQGINGYVHDMCWSEQRCEAKPDCRMLCRRWRRLVRLWRMLAAMVSGSGASLLHQVTPYFVLHDQSMMSEAWEAFPLEPGSIPCPHALSLGARL